MSSKVLKERELINKYINSSRLSAMKWQKNGNYQDIWYTEGAPYKFGKTKQVRPQTPPKWLLQLGEDVTSRLGLEKPNSCYVTQHEEHQKIKVPQHRDDEENIGSLGKEQGNGEKIICNIYIGRRSVVKIEEGGQITSHDIEDGNILVFDGMKKHAACEHAACGMTKHVAFVPPGKPPLFTRTCFSFRKDKTVVYKP